MKKICGIYKIENLINHKVYIGQSVDITKRWSEHKRKLKNNWHVSRHLQRAWNKYGSNKFAFKVIEECEIDKLTEREQYWIDFYGGINSPNNYNNKDAEIRGTVSDEIKRKISKSRMGINKGKRIDWLIGYDRNNPEYRKHLSESLKGKKKSKKHAENISKGRKGIIFGEEQRRKISESKKGNHNIPKGSKKMKKDGVVKWAKPEEIQTFLNNGWEEYHEFYAGENYVRKDPWNKGVPCSEEMKQHLREVNLGKKLSEATKRKMSESRKNMVWIHNDIKTTRVYKKDLEKYLNNGWTLGVKRK